MENQNIQPDDLSKLAEKLKGLKKPSLDEKKNFLIKYSVMSKAKVFGNKILAEKIADVSKDVELSTHQKVLIKENIFEEIENRQSRRSWSLGGILWGASKKVVSAAVMFVMVVGLFSYFNLDTQVVRAHNFTKLGSFTGDVKVYRNGEPVAVFVGMEIKENDKLITGPDAVAVIEYHDDSITRLSEETEIVINELDYEAEDVSKTYVEIDVKEGKVWSKVVNVVDEDSAFVVVANDITAEATQAAFNVAVDDGETEIEVFDHTVEIKSENTEIKNTPRTIDKKKVVKTSTASDDDDESQSSSRLYSGDKAVFNEGKTYIAVAEIDDEKEETDDWVKINLEEDKNYVEKVERKIIAEKSESIGIKEEEEISYDNSIREDATLLLTFDNSTEMKVELDLAEKAFIKAELKLQEEGLSRDEIMEAEMKLLDFAEIVVKFFKEIKEVEEVDPEYAEELRTYVSKKLKLRKKELATLLPDSDAYVAKSIIEQLTLLGAKDDEELVAMKYKQALTKLAELEDLIEAGEEDLVIRLVDDYEEEIKEVKQIVDQIDDSKKDVVEPRTAVEPEPDPEPVESENNTSQEYEPVDTPQVSVSSEIVFPTRTIDPTTVVIEMEESDIAEDVVVEDLEELEYKVKDIKTQLEGF